MSQKIEQDRKQFEKWIKTRMPSGSLDREYLPDHSSYYFNSLVEMAWQGWIAALASHAPSYGESEPQPPTYPCKIGGKPKERKELVR